MTDVNRIGFLVDKEGNIVSPSGHLFDKLKKFWDEMENKEIKLHELDKHTQQQAD